eukprot:gene21024-27247_t
MTDHDIISDGLAEYLKFCAYISNSTYFTKDKQEYDQSRVAVTSEIILDHPVDGKVTAFSIAFQGTNDLLDVWTDIESIIPVDFITTGYENIEPHVLVTGHSLGGAVAQLCAIDLIKSIDSKHNIKIYVATFGCPRTFDSKTAELIRNDINFDYYRSVNDEDPITAIPLVVKFGHIGTPIGFNPRISKWVFVYQTNEFGFSLTRNTQEFHGFTKEFNVHCHSLVGKA